MDLGTLSQMFEIPQAETGPARADWPILVDKLQVSAPTDLTVRLPEDCVHAGGGDVCRPLAGVMCPL